MKHVFNYTLLLGLLLFSSGIVLADIWRCDNRFFTSKNKPIGNCERIAASLLCGSDGNKYITPSNPDYPVVSEFCKYSKNSKNIFSTKSDKQALLDAKKLKKSDPKNKSGKSNSSESATERLQDLSKKGPQEILSEILSNPKSIYDLAKLIFPSLQEDFSD